jgi:hypothetical protein
MIYEYGIGGKWLELLKEIAPRLTGAAVLRDAAARDRTCVVPLYHQRRLPAAKLTGR